MTTVTYSIPAIHCHHCTHTIEMEVGELEGVKSVKADMESRKVQISFEPPASEERIKALLAEIQYPVGSGLLTI
jgi:copper ion binding protein